MQENTQNHSNIEQNSQNNVQNVSNSKKMLQQIKKQTPSWNLSFEEQIDKYVDGTLKSGNLLYLGETPNVLKQIGYDNNPITLKQSELKTIMKQSEDPMSHNHGISADIVKKLPEAIANPLNILKSSTDENSIVLITDLADNMERPIIASMQINSKGQVGNIKFLSNELTSAYGKRNYEEFMNREISKGNLIYDIDEGIKKESPATGLQSPKGIDSSEVSSTTNAPINNIIPSTDGTVNNQYMQNNENDVQEYYSISGNGYSGHSMSNNAIKAYEEGKKPISKFVKEDINKFNQLLQQRGINEKITLKELKALLEKYSGSEWHHTSSRYNKTNFYDINDVLENDNSDIENTIKEIRDSKEKSANIKEILKTKSGETEQEYYTRIGNYVLDKRNYIISECNKEL